MIASQEEEVLWVFQLIAKKEDYRFDGLFPAVDIVAQEKVVFLGWVPSIIEYFEQILELSMNVSYDFDGSL